MGKYQIFTHAKAKGFIETLDNKRKARIDRFYDLFEEYGPFLPRKYFKKLVKNIWELRPGDIRLFLTIKENKAFVVHAIKKKTQKIRQKDLNLAIRRIKEEIN